MRSRTAGAESPVPVYQRSLELSGAESGYRTSVPLGRTLTDPNSSYKGPSLLGPVRDGGVISQGPSKFGPHIPNARLSGLVSAHRRG
jgi:hypothetical protein